VTGKQVRHCEQQRDADNALELRQLAQPRIQPW